MKNLFTFILVLALGIGCLNAQTSPDNLAKQAQNSLDQKEYTTARYKFLLAYNGYINQKNYDKAADAGSKVAALYARENYYEEAFKLLNRMDQVFSDVEKADSTERPQLHYKTAKERLAMYIKLKNVPRSQEQINKMGDYAKKINKDEVNNDFQYSKANYYYAFGNTKQGDAAINQVIKHYESKNDYAKADESYKTLINNAIKMNNSRLVARTYDSYIKWSDSIRAVTAKDELSVMQKKFDDSQKVVAEKEHTISVKNGIIITLGIIATILVAALVFGFIILMRYMVLNRKQKKTIMIANEHNALKTQFIHNISTQMEPPLDTLDKNLPAVKALKSFSRNIQEMSDLETSLEEKYDLEDVNVQSFCEALMDEIRDKVKPGVTLNVNAPKMSAKFNAEATARILRHLLYNASLYTPADGKISLEYKKRGAHTQQFIVTDNGSGIPEEIRGTIFKPFTDVHDLTQGDGLGLPICSLMAAKSNGSLSLDDTFHNGARFVLELHN